jgi:fluoride exporter
MMKWWLLFAGGGIGSMLRYAVGLWVEARTGPGFPWGTFVVNISGCFLIGVIATLADEYAWITPAARLALVTGVLGGFTTFSTFGLETWELVEDGRALLALANAAASLAAGLAAVVVGVQFTRQLV